MPSPITVRFHLRRLQRWGRLICPPPTSRRSRQRHLTEQALQWHSGLQPGNRYPLIEHPLRWITSAGKLHRCQGHHLQMLLRRQFQIHLRSLPIAMERMESLPKRTDHLAIGLQRLLHKSYLQPRHRRLMGDGGVLLNRVCQHLRQHRSLRRMSPSLSRLTDSSL